jgi:hypothetical protein
MHYRKQHCYVLKQVDKNGVQWSIEVQSVNKNLVQVDSFVLLNGQLHIAANHYWLQRNISVFLSGQFYGFILRHTKSTN